MEQGIADNVLEMALRGKPKDPFYMVGRMEGQSVILRAEKGKLRLMVDDEESGIKREMVYDVAADGSGEMGETNGKGGELGDRREERALYGGGEMPGGPVGMDGEAQTRGGLPGTRSGVDRIEAVAGAGDGGDAPGPAAASADEREDSGVERASCGIVGTEERSDERVGEALSTSAVQGSSQAEEPGQARGVAGGWSLEEYLAILTEIANGSEAEAKEGRGAGACASAGAGDPESAERSLHGEAGGSSIGGVAKDLLRVGREVVESDGPGAGEPARGEAARACGRGEGGPSGTDPGVGEEAGCGREDHRGQGTAGGL